MPVWGARCWGSRATVFAFGGTSVDAVQCGRARCTGGTAVIVPLTNVLLRRPPRCSLHGQRGRLHARLRGRGPVSVLRMLSVLCALGAQHGGCMHGSRRPEPARPSAIRPAPLNQLSRAQPSFLFVLSLLQGMVTHYRAQRQGPSPATPCTQVIFLLLFGASTARILLALSKLQLSRPHA